MLKLLSAFGLRIVLIFVPMHSLFTLLAKPPVRAFFASLFLMLALGWGASTVYASPYRQFLPGDDIFIGEFVFDDDFVATTTAGCTVTVYDTGGSVFINAAPMSVDPNGYYAYSFTPTDNQGVWPAFMTCGSALNGSLVRMDKTFEITERIVSSSTVAALVNANTNAAVATASSSLSATLPNSIWAFSGRTLTSFGTLVADIWASGTRTLTGFGTLAADVWTSATRTLTGAGLTTGSLATLSDLQTATSSLGSAITNSEVAINANTDTRVGIATSSLAAVVNANTNSAILTASTSLGSTLASLGSSITAIPAAVWNVATTTMTTPGTIGYVLANNIDVAISSVSGGGGGGLTAADVWAYGTRSLTSAALSAGSLALQSDVTTASSSLGSAITNSQTAINSNTDARVGIATSSLAAVINANTDAQVLTASTSLGSTLSSITSSIASIPTNVWAAGTRTLTGFGTLAADVWTNGTRTLTGAGLTTGSLATNADINSATTSVNTTIANASSSVVALVNANTNSVTSGITTAVNSNTDATVLAASSSLATSIPINVWNSSVRTLTSFGTLASDVWSAATRTLTGAGLTSGSLATLTDVQTASSSVAAVVNANTDSRVGIASSSLAAVINANTDAQVLTASTSLGSTLSSITSSITALPAAVWNVATTTMTTPGTIGYVLANNIDLAISAVSGGGGGLTAADVWAYGSRSLTSAALNSGSLATNADINSATTSVNTTIATASSSVVTLVNANTDSRVTTASSSLGSAITNSQTAVNSNTDATVLAASSSLATSIPVNVWNSSVRTLTSFGTLASDVWSAATRTLTGAGLTSGSLATLSDVQTASSSVAAVVNANTNGTIGTASSSLATVINANTNATVLTASTSLGSTLSSITASIASIPTNVWTAGTRTLTGFGTLAADVWTNGTRTLTGANLSSGSLATLTDVQTASSSVAAVVNANTDSRVGTASSSLVTVINANTNSAVLTASTSLGTVINANTNTAVLNASTSLGSTLSTLSSSITAIPTAVWNVATTTMTTAGSIGKVLATNIDAAISTIGGGSLTVSDIWNYSARTLTGAALNSGSLATNADINSATTSVNTTITTASSSLAMVVNANTNATVLTASTSLASGIASGFASVPANVWAYSSRTLSSFGTLASDVWSAATRTLTGAGLTSGNLATQNDVQTASTSLAAAIATKATLVNQQAGWTVRQSDFGSVLAGSTFRTKVTVLNYQSAPTTPFATPTVTVYDASRNVVASGVAMTALSTGVYEYTYSVASLAAQGQWEAVVSTQVESGKTITTNDYFEVAGSPAQVLIQSMGSLATPNITANVRITNEGLADYEYQYEWCVVSNINNPCGGGDDTYYASAAKLINAGDNFDTILSATVPTEGIYYFKTVVYFGTESSGASRQFTTSLYVPPTTGGGGGGGGGGGNTSSDSCGVADTNCDGKVSAVDFSIMLAYWKTTAPFKNTHVDLNGDKKVDAVDFSILLYHWGKKY